MKNFVLKKYLGIFCVDLIVSLIMFGVISYAEQDKDLGLMIFSNMCFFVYIVATFLSGIIGYLTVKSLVYSTICKMLSLCVSVVSVCIVIILIDNSISTDIVKTLLGVSICSILVGGISGILTKIILKVLKNLKKTRDRSST